jgi:capsular exopolysaccharide synthesis family protein
MGGPDRTLSSIADRPDRTLTGARDGYSVAVSDMQQAPGREAGLNLLDYWSAIWRRKFTVLLTVVIAVVAALGIDTVRSREYSSTAQLLFLSQGSTGTSPGAASNSSLSTTEIATDIQLVQSTKVKAEAGKLLHHSPPPAVVSQVGTTQGADITVTSTDKALAANAANAYANAYIKVTTQQYLKSQLTTATYYQKQLTSIQSSISSLQSHLAGVKTGSATATNLSSQLTGLYSQQSALQQQLTALQLATSQSSAGGELVQPATASASPSSPKRAQDALIAALIGLVAGIGFALLRDRLDDRIRSKADLEATVGGLPAIGLIPMAGEWRDSTSPFLISAGRSKSPAAEAYRGLRTSIQFAALDNPIKVLQITSPAKADGKTTTSANLAWTMAEAGQNVVLVGCDLRRPRIHEFFGISNQMGLTSVLLGEVPLAEALQPVADQPRLRILASGPIPPNPSELLSSRAVGEIFTALSNHADIVLIDSAPVLPVTDAAVLATRVDATILIAAAGISTRRETARALETLTRVGASIIGVVLNRAPDTDAYVYYGYGYGYGYGSGYEEKPEDNDTNGTNGNSGGRSGWRRAAAKGRHAAPVKGSE